ncbi:MoaD/ThiS family protein [Mycobacterium marseillense]|jgi:molybdopterin converting factor small subunit|uniref:Molybdopterin synthase sulfur carrier subunit n=1 Tax=Mycobacterium marseillense TaxID=701042 RepID=A0AAC9VSW1_9MYCO|nr:MoaD/ThiS family protein [Mycobacterium marseillense]ASW89211.1 MoaD/ThiS family protein [Mycobacterium marseillense]MCA2264285.1 MoaD/ThiS family protein [Mycobacterium marseillense]MCV7406524.1 MoaD/ThiS family protein [Mycobacterium marseillense]MDM3976284.1 MoaD/ThiS family protein [Mycobacterium marseillense]OBJ75610.1 molybdopterin synthase sulfur carrier subunit [Mycobacterium marseillense]
MGQSPVQATGIGVTVRYFAAAHAAAGVEAETLVVRPGTTVGELVERLATRGSRLATVLSRCSYLCDGVAVRDETTTLQSGDTIDVLPPFSGG